MFNVHVRVNDAATGQPTPVRLRISDATGREYPPLGRVAEFATGRNEDVGGHVMLDGQRWYYTDGACEVALPGGVPLVIEATKGPEYKPVRKEITLGVGQMALRLTIERWINLRAEGWYSGDTRCHFLSPHAALLEAQAEDLAVTQLLATEADIASQDGKLYQSIANMTAFSGQQPCLERPGHVVAVNTFNTHPVLGSLALLHCHRAVFPLSFGGADATDDWSLADWCDQCHRKKGLAVWANAFRADAIAPEALADLVMGRIDAVEATPGQRHLAEWHRAWSAGIRFPLIGASGTDCNRVALGSMRTYARLRDGDEFNVGNWVEAVRAGRTFVTTGPILRLEVEGQQPGAIIDHAEPGQTVEIVATFYSLGPFQSPMRVGANGDMQLEVNGNGGATYPVGPDETGIGFVTGKSIVRIDGPSWIALRVWAQNGRVFAHTSPVFIRVGGKMPVNAEVSRQYAERLGRTVDWVDSTGRFEIPRRKEQLRAILEQARQELLSRAGA
jgi:hypothetical protein